MRSYCGAVHRENTSERHMWQPVGTECTLEEAKARKARLDWKPEVIEAKEKAK